MTRFADDTTAVILAAGHGQRMMPLTQWIPKPLVPVNGKPVLVGNIEALADAGFSNIVVVYGRPTASIPDFLATTRLPDVQISCVFQKEQHGTGDALYAAMGNGVPTPYYLLMVGDTCYPAEYVRAVWTRFAEKDIDGCLLLKELPQHKLGGSSVVQLADDDSVVAMVSKPSPAVLRRLRSRLADASLHVYRRDLKEHLAKAPLSPAGELEVTAALVSWIAAGARLAGVVRSAPVHMTSLEDLVVHDVPFGRRLVGLAAIEEALASGSDRDLSGYVSALEPPDLAFAYRRLQRLVRQSSDAKERARVYAIVSEMFRQNAERCGADIVPSVGPAAAEVVTEEQAAELAEQVVPDCPDPTLYHRLAVAHARLTNQTVGDQVLREAMARLPAATAPDRFRDRVEVTTPARLAFSSSQGSDISYIIQEKSSAILNCAIEVDGKRPGAVTVEKLPVPEIRLSAADLGASATLRTADEVWEHAAKDDPTVLLRASLRFCGVLDTKQCTHLDRWLLERGGGFHLTVRCALPMGSGLGCSAILAAGCVRALREFAGLPTSDTELLTRGYCCERYYGRSGYQDIIGGCIEGVKLIQADGSTGLFNPRVERLDLTSASLAALRERLVVFHTGQPHVSSPYLLTIPAKYFTRSGDYMFAYESGKQLTGAMAEALSAGNWGRLGELIGEYWDDREHFEPGVTPNVAARMRRELAPLCHGTALCGSGHGGYMMAVTMPGQRAAVLERVSDAMGAGSILDFEVSREGMQVQAT